MRFVLADDGERKFAPNFKIKEFACKDNSQIIEIDIGVIILLQQMRDKLNKPIKIISGYRSESYNETIGGAKKSLHCKGIAVDIACDGVAVDTLAELGKAVGFNGIGYYDRWVHLDLRDNPYTWDERTKNEN